MRVATRQNRGGPAVEWNPERQAPRKKLLISGLPNEIHVIGVVRDVFAGARVVSIWRLVYPAPMFGTRRVRNEQQWGDGVEIPPPVELPHREAASLAMSLLWAYAEAQENDEWTDLRPILREHEPIDPEDWYSAKQWLSEESLVELEDWDPEGLELASVTPLGWSMLRWWGWEDLGRASNPSQIRAGDFLVVREPATRRYYVVECGDGNKGECVMVTLLGPDGGASSPSSAAMWARRIGGTDARVWLIETRQMHFPIARSANALAAKDRLRAV